MAISDTKFPKVRSIAAPDPSGEFGSMDRGGIAGVGRGSLSFVSGMGTDQSCESFAAFLPPSSSSKDAALNAFGGGGMEREGASAAIERIQEMSAPKTGRAIKVNSAIRKKVTDHGSVTS